MRDRAQPAQRGRGVVAAVAPALELDRAQPGDEHALLPAIERDQRARDRLLAAAAGVALGALLAQPLERVRELRRELRERVLPDPLRRRRDEHAARRAQRRAQRRHRVSRRRIEPAQRREPLVERGRHHQGVCRCANSSSPHAVRGKS